MAELVFDVKAKLDSLEELLSKIKALRDEMKKIDSQAEPQSFKKHEEALSELLKKYNESKSSFANIANEMGKVANSMNVTTLPIEKIIEILDTLVAEQKKNYEELIENKKSLDNEMSSPVDTSGISGVKSEVDGITSAFEDQAESILNYKNVISEINNVDVSINVKSGVDEINKIEDALVSLIAVSDRMEYEGYSPDSSEIKETENAINDLIKRYDELSISIAKAKPASDITGVNLNTSVEELRSYISEYHKYFQEMQGIYASIKSSSGRLEEYGIINLGTGSDKLREQINEQSKLLDLFVEKIKSTGETVSGIPPINLTVDTKDSAKKIGEVKLELDKITDLKSHLDSLMELHVRIDELSDSLSKLDANLEPTLFKEQEKALQSLKMQYSETVSPLKGIISEMSNMGKLIGETTLPIDKSIQVLKVFVSEQEKYLETLRKNIRSLQKEIDTKGIVTQEGRDNLVNLNISKKDFAEQEQLIKTYKDAIIKLTVEQKNLGNSSTTVRSQMNAIREEMSRMTLAGKENTEEFHNLQNELARLGTAYNDVSKQQRLLTTAGNQYIAGIISGIQGLSGAFTAFQGVASLFVNDNEKMAKVQKNLQAAMSITMGLQSVSSMLHSQSAFRIATTTKVTQGWNAIQKALNVTLGISAGLSKALMVGGIGVLIGGITLLVSAFKKWKREQEEINRLNEISKTALEDVAKATSDASTKEVSSIGVLYRASQDMNKSYEERLSAVKELQKKYPSYFGNLSQEEILAGKAAGAYESLKDQIIATAKARALSDKVGELAVQKFDLEQENIKSQEKLLEEQRKLDAARDKRNKDLGDRSLTPEGAAATLIVGAVDVTSVKKAIKAEENAVKDRMKTIAAIEKTSEELEKAINIKDSTTVIGDNNANKIKSVAKKENNALEELKKLREDTERQDIGLIKDSAEKARKEAVFSYEKRIDEIGELEKKWQKEYGNLSDDQITVLKSARNMAVAVYNNSLNEIAEAETKANEDIINKYAGYTKKRLNILESFKNERKKLEDAGAGQAQYDELDYSQTKALEAVDMEFAQREESFQVWANSISNIALDKLKEMLKEAEVELSKMETVGNIVPATDLSAARGQIIAIKNQIQQLQIEEKKVPAEDSYKRWAKLQSVLQKTQKQFDDIGDSIGGTFGEIIKAASGLTTSTLSMIDGIAQLTTISIESTEKVAQAGSEAIQQVERASVILAIVSAALKVVTTLFNLFKRTDYMAEFRKEVTALNKELKLVKLNSEIDSFTGSSIFGDDLWRNAKNNIKAASQALKDYNDTLNSIKNRDNVSSLLKGISKEYSTAAESIAKMQVQIRHSTWFRSAKYESLQQAVPELFNSDGSINKEALQSFIGTDTFKKLSAANQSYLQDMANSWEIYQDAVDSTKNYLTSIFGELGSNMSDALVDAFHNGTDAAAAFVDSVSEMLDKLAQDMIYAVTLAPLFDQASEDFLNIMKDPSITDTQRFKQFSEVLSNLGQNALAQQSAYNELLSEWELIKESAGLTPTTTTTQTLTSATGGYTTMSEETASVLEGRFTALQQSGEEIKLQNIAQTDIIKTIDSKLIDISGNNIAQLEIADETRSILVNSYIELQMISDNTSETVKHIKEMKDDIATMRRLGSERW